MRILGIDPGYAIMGWGVVDYAGNHFTAVDYGSITTKAGLAPSFRLCAIYRELRELISRYRPDQAAVEQLYFNNNAKTVIMVGEARGVALLACAEDGLLIGEYTPLQIKQALVGYGRAEKNQIQQMVKTILHLPDIPKPDDTADALAAAICHGNSTPVIKYRGGQGGPG